MGCRMFSSSNRSLLWLEKYMDIHEQKKNLQVICIFSTSTGNKCRKLPLLYRTSIEHTARTNGSKSPRRQRRASKTITGVTNNFRIMKIKGKRQHLLQDSSKSNYCRKVFPLFHEFPRPVITCTIGSHVIKAGDCVRFQ